MKFIAYAFYCLCGGLLLSYLIRRRALRQPCVTITNIRHPDVMIYKRGKR